MLKGSIVYAKDGNLWIEDATGAHQITSPGTQADPGVDQMPSFTPDGKYIIYVEVRDKRVLWKLGLHAPTYYTATYPIIYRIKVDGTGRQQLATGLYKAGRFQWWYWMRQPVLSPNGHTIALFSDGPDPTQSNVVLQFYDTATHKLTKAGVPEYPPLGHQDADWSPDGKTLLYVKNGRDGARGAPQIYRYDVKAKTYQGASPGPGYEAPRFSPDGRYIAATRTSALGTDVVILDARNGNELTRITDDAHSWGARRDCPSCGGSSLAEILHWPSLPVNAALFPATRAESLSISRGSLRLTVCERCGLVFNADHDGTLVEYPRAVSRRRHALPGAGRSRTRSRGNGSSDTGSWAGTSWKSDAAPTRPFSGRSASSPADAESGSTQPARPGRTATSRSSRSL